MSAGNLPPQGRVPETSGASALQGGLGRDTLLACCKTRSIGLCPCVSARTPVRSGNPDWLPDSAGPVTGSPRTWKVRP
eukprot:2915741-Prymnesium_polylepis.1